MNGPDWLYRIKGWPTDTPVNSDADLKVLYTTDWDAVQTWIDVLESRGFSVEIASASVGDFFKVDRTNSAC